MVTLTDNMKTYCKKTVTALADYFRLARKTKTAQSKADAAKEQSDAAKIHVFELLGIPSKENQNGDVDVVVVRNQDGDRVQVTRRVSQIIPKATPYTRVVDRIGKYCGK